MSLMNILGGLADNLINQQGAHGPAVTAIIGVLQQEGGVTGVVQKLQAAGLGEHLASWTTPAENLPVTGDQMHAALGTDTVAQIADKLGISHGEAADHLAQLLPSLLGGLAQNGQLPGAAQGGTAGGIEGAALAAFGSLFGAKA